MTVTVTGTRRANGEASYHRDSKTGRWHGYVTLGKRADGRPDRRHRRGRTRAEVVAKIAALVRAHDAGRVLAADSTSLEQWLTHWLTEMAPARLRAKTLASYRTDVVRHLIPHLGQVRLRDLTWERIERFEASMRAETVTDAAGRVRRRYRPATIDHVRRTLRSALNDAVRSNVLSSNPASQVRRVVDQSLDSAEFVGSPLSQEETRRVIEVARSANRGAQEALRLIYGLRQGELLGLPWSNVHLDDTRPRFVVSQQLQRHTYRHGCGDPLGR